MPQIQCPNCGTTINLENRRTIDFNLILRAVQKKPRTFTELLHITHLPRKTLSLRLKALCKSGGIKKEEEGGYRSNGWSPNMRGEKMSTTSINFPKPRLTRKQILVAILLLCIGVPISAQVQAMLFPYSPPPSPKYYGTLTVNVNIYNVIDLYAWQIGICFNPDELVYHNDTEGAFLPTANPPYGTVYECVGDVYEEDGELLLGGCLIGGPIQGASGSGTLATITFNIKCEGTPNLPWITFDETPLETVLFNSNKCVIPIESDMLTIETN